MPDKEYLLVLVQRDVGEGRLKVLIKRPISIYSLSSDLKENACEFDKSYIVRIGNGYRNYDVIEKAIKLAFRGYDFRQITYPKIWKKTYEERPDSDIFPYCFVSNDADGSSVARKIVDFVCHNRLRFGDDGEWALWALNDFLQGRSGVNLSDLAHKWKMSETLVKHLPDADYTDELGSFRFPSTSCLYGVSQPLSKLRGAVKFRKLFIQDGAGVYIAFDGDEVLYVGMSQTFSQRLSNADTHHKLKVVRERHPEARVAVIHYPFWKLPEYNAAVTSEEKDAAWGRIRALLFGIEAACIEYYQPRYNGRLTDELSEYDQESLARS